MERWKTEWSRGMRMGALAGLLGLAVLLALGSGADDAAACTRASLGGGIRQCTLTENFGQCVRDSEDAYWQCRRRHPGFWGAIRCSLANNLDQMSCVLETGAFGILKGARGAFGG